MMIKGSTFWPIIVFLADGASQPLQRRNYPISTIVFGDIFGATAANGVDRVQAGSRFRRELDFVHRFPLFPWLSSVGNAYG